MTPDANQIIDLTPPPGNWPALPPMPAGDIASGSADQTGVQMLESPGLSIGFWGCSPWVATPGPYPWDEFMILLEGSVTIRLPDGRAETIREGEAFFIPKGLDCQWDQPDPVRKIYVIFEAGAPATAPDLPLRVDIGMALTPSPGPAAAVLTSPAPDQMAAEVYADASGQFAVGVWATTPYMRKPISYPRHEVMHLLEGSVTLTVDGVSRVWTAGETFLVPLGCVVDWHSTVPVKKIYCSIIPRGR